MSSLSARNGVFCSCRKARFAQGAAFPSASRTGNRDALCRAAALELLGSVFASGSEYLRAVITRLHMPQIIAVERCDRVANALVTAQSRW